MEPQVVWHRPLDESQRKGVQLVLVPSGLCDSSAVTQMFSLRGTHEVLSLQRNSRPQSASVWQVVPHTSLAQA